jgi:hypothetical protein
MITPAQQAYSAQLDQIEAEKLAALNAPGAKADQMNIIMLRKMSAALVQLRKAQLKAPQG